MNKKVDYTKAEGLQKQTYFDCKADMIPASIKEIYSDVVSKQSVLVARELIVDNRTFIGIEYAPSGEIANVYTTDGKGKRVNFENATEDKNNTASDLISQRLEAMKTVVHDLSQDKGAKTTEKPVATKDTVLKKTTLNPTLKRGNTHQA